MVCDKCGKNMGSRSIEHQIDHTFFLCDDCYQKLVDWINEDDLDWYDIPAEEMTLEQARSAVRELRKKVAEQFAKTQNEWISVKDRPPDDDEPVLVYAEDGVMSVCSLVVANAFTNLKNLKVWDDNDGYDVCDVTHWMPLPQKPESEDDSE